MTKYMQLDHHFPHRLIMSNHLYKMCTFRGISSFMLHLELDLGYISSLGLKRAYLITLMDIDIQSHSVPMTMYQVVYKILFAYCFLSLTHKFGKNESKYECHFP